LRKKSPDSDKRIEGTHIFTEKKIFTVYSNHGAITAALRYIRAAISELEVMKLTPALDFARIEELRHGIPDTGEMQKYSAEKPFPRTPPTEYELLKMDEQAGTTEYLLQKLYQKYEKWKIGATKSPKAGKREAPAIKEATLHTYQEEKRKIRAFLGGASRLDPRR